MHCFVTSTLFTKILAYNTFRSELQLAATTSRWRNVETWSKFMTWKTSRSDDRSAVIYAIANDYWVRHTIEIDWKTSPWIVRNCVQLIISRRAIWRYVSVGIHLWMYSISYVWISVLCPDVSPPRISRGAFRISTRVHPGGNAERTVANVPGWKRLETIGLYTHDSTRLKTIQNDWATAPSVSF